MSKKPPRHFLSSAFRSVSCGNGLHYTAIPPLCWLFLFLLINHHKLPGELLIAWNNIYKQLDRRWQKDKSQVPFFLFLFIFDQLDYVLFKAHNAVSLICSENFFKNLLYWTICKSSMIFTRHLFFSSVKSYKIKSSVFLLHWVGFPFFYHDVILDQVQILHTVQNLHNMNIFHCWLPYNPHKFRNEKTIGINHI